MSLDYKEEVVDAFRFLHQELSNLELAEIITRRKRVPLYEINILDINFSLKELVKENTIGKRMATLSSGRKIIKYSLVQKVKDYGI